MGRAEVKVPDGKLVRVECRTEHSIIKSIKISGDFFLYPEESIITLENNLQGIKTDRGEVRKIIENFINQGNRFLGLNKEDLTEAIIKAI